MSEKATPTPGPWVAELNFVYKLNAHGVNRFAFSVSGGYTDQKGERTLFDELCATAALAASAPTLAAENAELREMVKRCVVELSYHERTDLGSYLQGVTEIMRDARALLARRKESA